MEGDIKENIERNMRQEKGNSHARATLFTYGINLQEKKNRLCPQPFVSCSMAIEAIFQLSILSLQSSIKSSITSNTENMKCLNRSTLSYIYMILKEAVGRRTT